MTTMDLAARLRDASPEEFADELIRFIADRGRTNYDEAVTQLEHALQTAALAKAEDGRDEVVVAALLHDIGHLLEDEHADSEAFLKEDLCHETVASEFLSPWFDDSVTAPILHHVAAKRYLCTVDPAYHDGLSQASQRSLELQGGVLSDEEREAFERLPHLDVIVMVRRWDDRAKVNDLDVPPLESYAATIASVRRMHESG